MQDQCEFEFNQSRCLLSLIHIFSCMKLLDFHLFSGAIFLLVLDLSKYEMNDCTYRIMVGDWINLIIGHIPGAVITIVPTHLDICESQGENVDDKCKDILLRVSAEEQERVKLLEKDLEVFKTEGTDMAKVETIDFLRKARPHFPSCVYNEVKTKNLLLVLAVVVVQIIFDKKPNHYTAIQL